MPTVQEWLQAAVKASQDPFVQAEAGTIAWGNRRQESRARPLGRARLSG